MERRNFRHFEVRRTAGALGAELHGVDLAQDLADDVIAEIRQAWLDHLVLFFRDQKITPAQQLAFARRLGEPIAYPQLKGLDAYPMITPVVKLESERNNFGGVWHSDTTYLQVPPMASMLYAIELPPVGGDTEFANQYLAYETLSPGMQAMLQGLVGVSSSMKAEASKTREDRLKAARRSSRWRPSIPSCARPGDRAQGAVLERRPHREDQGLDREGKRRTAGLPVRAPDPAGIHLPLPLATGLAGAVGQSLRHAQRDQRLPRIPPHPASHHAGRRPAGVTGYSCGQRRCQSVPASYSAPSRRTEASSRKRPTSCRPIGKPSDAKPQHTLIAGCPVMLNGMV